MYYHNYIAKYAKNIALQSLGILAIFILCVEVSTTFGLKVSVQCVIQKYTKFASPAWLLRGFHTHVCARRSFNVPKFYTSSDYLDKYKLCYVEN